MKSAKAAAEKRCRLSAVWSFLLFTSCLHAQTVNNVRVQQLQTGSHPVEVLYDLAAAPPEGAYVALTFSLSAAGPPTVLPRTAELSGDVGRGVPNGANKRILWNAPAGTCATVFATVWATGCTLSVAPSSRSFPISGGGGTFTVTTSQTPCSWTASSNADWIAVTSGSTGSGTQNVTYAVNSNPGPARSGTITVAGQVVTIDQAGGTDEITVSLPGGVALVLVRIPAGTFLMGSPGAEAGRVADEVSHPVTLTRDFYMGKTEVTQKQWRAVMGSTNAGCGTFGDGDNYPIYCVSWNDIAGAGGFLEKLNSHLSSTGQPGAGAFRLPSEAEWERAARAQTQTRFSFGDAAGASGSCGGSPSADPHVWWCGNSSSGTQPVALKLPNTFGLYDMHGNVAEWCQDRYGSYPAAAVTDPPGPLTGTVRVLRGGSWFLDLGLCRSAVRDYEGPNFRSGSIGFRLARSL